MGLNPKIQTFRPPFISKTCARCNTEKPIAKYLKSKSLFSDQGYTTICADCITEILAEQEFNWEIVNKFCQYMDIPFIPAEFEKFRTANGDQAFNTYSQVFFEAEYQDLSWGEYFEQFKTLKETGFIEDELPEIREYKFSRLREKWGENYSDEDLTYLEGLYNGLLTGQNINGALQIDQAKKLCKISLEIDSRIRAGADFDKMLTSYDKLVKIAEFTPKNAKNMSDFDSIGEIVLWLEKRGWVNKYYDGVTQDVVDATIMNIQASNQRLYVNESGIGDDITQRLNSLQRAQELEDYYDLDKDYDLEDYQDEAWRELDQIDGEFNTNV